MNADPADVVALLQAMVQIDSVSLKMGGRAEGEKPLADYLESLARAWGLETRFLPVEGYADQLLVTYQVDAALPWVLFDSHLDTVAVEGMTIDPFGGEVRDGKVWGRGACDTKGTGAAMLWAMRRYAAAADAARPNNIALLFSVDEEVAMHGIRSFVQNDLPTLGWRPGAAVVGEPSELRPIIAHNGCIRWTLTTHGKACHSSVPHDGRSAISAMVRVIDRIERDYIPTLDASHPLTGYAACSINLIRGGSAPNIIPDQCTIEIDRRLVPGEDGDQVLPAIAELLEPLRRGGGGQVPVEFTQEVVVAHPVLSDANNGALTEAVRSVLRDMGLSTLVVGAPFATHACYFDRAGIPAMVVGPGSAHTAHTKDEWVAIEQIERGVELYEGLMRSAQE